MRCMVRAFRNRVIHEMTEIFMDIDDSATKEEIIEAVMDEMNEDMHVWRVGGDGGTTLRPDEFKVWRNK